MTMIAKKVAFHTMGCKLNFSETSTISRKCVDEGYEKVPFQEKADIYVINTCSVTENADKECNRMIRKKKEAQPDSLVVIIGCYAQLKPKEIAQIDGVDLVLGATEKFKLPFYLNSLVKDEVLDSVYSCDVEEANQFESAYSIGDRTRAFLKVQDGCDYKCTYCTIPQARGISRSDDMESIIQKAQEIAQQDIKEIVLTGVNIGDYGKGEFGNKRHEHTFLDLITYLDEVAGIERIRISSIEPNLLKNEAIDLVSKSRTFVPHFHIPLQSGSNEILGAMRRRYRKELYLERVKRIKSTMPHACIGVDVIVGFPGETEEIFLETYDFLSSLDISYLHVFSYSQRANTIADQMENQIPKATKSKRSKMLRILSAKKRHSFYESQLGTVVPVLFEQENKNGFITGFSNNYVKVKVDYDPGLRNQIVSVLLKEIDENDGTVIGVLQ